MKKIFNVLFTIIAFSLGGILSLGYFVISMLIFAFVFWVGITTIVFIFTLLKTLLFSLL